MSESHWAPNTSSTSSTPIYLKYEKPKENAKKDKTGFGKKILRKLKRDNMVGYFDKIRSDVSSKN